MKRLFAAIKIHPDEQFRKIYNQLKFGLSEDKIKWVDLNNTHLTLKFFGETPEEQIDKIAQAMDEAVLDAAAFEIHLKNTGIFGSRYNPRVIWFGIEPNDQLQNLYSNLKKNLEELGYEYDRQNFVPHLTVGRIRNLKNKHYFQKVIDKYKNVELQKEQINKLILYESILRPTGPEYIVVEEFKL